MKENSTFLLFDWDNPGLLFDESDHPEYPLKYYSLADKNKLMSLDSNNSYFVYVVSDGLMFLRANHTSTHLIRGQYMSIGNEGGTLYGLTDDTKAIVIEILPEKQYKDYRSMFVLGGPIEPVGRLKYIDRCSDSLLIPPIIKGDPCLNHLHFPTEVFQTPHTHPSHRIGVVASGKGECVTPFGNTDLNAGDIFIIKEYDGVTTGKGIDGNEYPAGTHSFNTYDDILNVIAFHPDSDFGPEHDDHPMVNRTIVDGKSAKDIPDIRTK